MFVRVCCVRVCCVVHTKGQRSRNEGPPLFIPLRVACREDGSDWSILQPIAGATVECPRIAAWGNGIRDRDSRRDGRVFQFPSQTGVLSALRL